MTIWLSRFVLVEDVQATIDAFVNDADYQESVTQKLANALQATVRTEGRHGAVDVACVCKPK